MNKKIISVALLLLCIISVIIGGINTFNQECAIDEKQSEVESNIKSFLSYSQEKIALITLEGPISSEISGSFLGDIYSAQGVLKALKKAEENEKVKGILLKINSPGGTVAMSQEIYNSVLRIRDKKPIIVSMGDVCASGGYYIASAADRIYAQPGTLTGSIGVIFSSVNVEDLMQNKLGVKAVIIKSGKFKDTGSMYRQMTQEERNLLQNMIDDSYSQFLSAIKRGRIQRIDKYNVKRTNLEIDTLKKYADGRVFTGSQSLKLGFIDNLGGTYEAHKALNEIIEGEDLELVPFNKPAALSSFFFNMSENIGNINPMKTTMPFSMKNSRKLLYIWE